MRCDRQQDMPTAQTRRFQTRSSHSSTQLYSSPNLFIARYSVSSICGYILVAKSGGKNRRAVQ